MRAKHIFLPIAAVALLGSYAIHTNVQKSKFDSEAWKKAHYEDSKGAREDMLSPLLVHVLKFGMSLEEVDDLLGFPEEERRGGNQSTIGAPIMQYYYGIEKENTSPTYLVVEFSSNMKVTNFYLTGRPQTLIF